MVVQLYLNEVDPRDKCLLQMCAGGILWPLNYEVAAAVVTVVKTVKSPTVEIHQKYQCCILQK